GSAAYLAGQAFGGTGTAAGGARGAERTRLPAGEGTLQDLEARVAREERRAVELSADLDPAQSPGCGVGPDRDGLSTRWIVDYKTGQDLGHPHLAPDPARVLAR